MESGEGKGPEEKFGSGDFLGRGTKVNHCRVEKNQEGVETTVVRRSWDKAPAGPAYGRSGIRHTGGLNLEEAVVWNRRTLASMQTEKPQVD